MEARRGHFGEGEVAARQDVGDEAHRSSAEKGGDLVPITVTFPAGMGKPSKILFCWDAQEGQEAMVEFASIHCRENEIRPGAKCIQLMVDSIMEQVEVRWPRGWMHAAGGKGLESPMLAVHRTTRPA